MLTSLPKHFTNLDFIFFYRLNTDIIGTYYEIDERPPLKDGREIKDVMVKKGRDEVRLSCFAEHFHTLESFIGIEVAILHVKVNTHFGEKNVSTITNSCFKTIEW